MQLYKRISLFFFLLLVSTAVVNGQTAVAAAPSKARVIVDEMSRAMDRVVTCTGRVKRLERIEGKMESGDLKFRVNSKPRKIYVYNITPDEGAELLYVDGWNGNKVFVHPNKFPWVNVSLSPNSSELLDKQHHNLFAVGFDYSNGIVKHLLSKYGHEFDKYVSYGGQQKWYGKMMDVIKIKYDNYKIENYTVLAGEDLFKIDTKLHVPAYKIIELNPGISDFFDVKAGQVIKVPNVYAPKITIFVDPDLHLPIVQVIEDEKGMFEKYEYSELKINPRFNTMEFNEDNEEYGF
jgi:outer membrane lipoprotein-sorting protein